MFYSFIVKDKMLLFYKEILFESIKKTSYKNQLI